MTKGELIKLLRNDVPAWNRWRQRNPERSFSLAKVRFVGTDLEHADLGQINLSKADFSNAILKGANLCQTDLSGANFLDADLTGANLSKVLAHGAVFVRAGLLGADLSGGDFQKADFERAVLLRTDLSGADLDTANLRDTDLREANLHRSQLWRTDLTASNLIAADLSQSQFYGATLARCLFGKNNFTDAIMHSAVLTDVDLSTVTGLERVEHWGPSSIGIDTLYRSQGKIPESFLRDAGVPEELITFHRSLIEAQEGIQFYSCFISYSHQDEEFARRLHGRMRDAKLRVWYAPVDMRGGQKIHEQIETAIRIYDKLLVVLSEASLSSEWVKTEIRNARRQERKTGKRKLFPVRLVPFERIAEWNEFDADSGKDLGVEMREYFIPDFTQWKDHDKFEAEFERLLRDLKADGLLPSSHGMS